MARGRKSKNSGGGLLALLGLGVIAVFEAIASFISENALVFSAFGITLVVLVVVFCL